MKQKKILSILLTLVTVIGMMPYYTFAKTDLTWSGGTITLESDTKIGTAVLTTLSIYKQGATSVYPEIVSASQEGSVIDITLAGDTSDSYPLQMGFSGSSGYFQNANNTCTLKNGKGTANVTVQAKAAPAPNAPVYGTGTFTVNFTIEAGEVYEVTVPEGEEFTFEGDTTAGKDRDYSFRVTAKEGYDSSEMTVRVNGNEIASENGIYTVPCVNEKLVITVEGIVKKSVYTVTLTEGTGYTIKGQSTSYADEPYTFTVSVDDDIYWAAEIDVKIDGEAVALTNGSYTIESLDSDKVVTVENITERELFTVTLPELEGATVNGNTDVRDGKSYTFTVLVDEKYDGTNMTVTVNGSEILPEGEKYTVESVSESITIVIDGITKKDICEIIKPLDGKFTFVGDDFAYIGNEYTFTVTPNPGYTANVKVNGEAVEGSNNKYTFTAEEGEMVITVETVKDALPEKEIAVSVSDGAYTADASDNALKPFSSYHATVTGIRVSGAQVTSAFENGTTVYFNLHSSTPDISEITVEFLYTNKSCTLKNNILNITLEKGEAGIVHTVTADYNNGWKTKSATYTLVFFREIPSENPPVCIKSSDVKEVWKGRALGIDISGYFTDADSYYLVNGNEKAPIDGKEYTFTSEIPGEHILTFTAENEAGESAEHLSLTIIVKDVESGVYIGHESGNGALNSVRFLDADGIAIDGIEVSYDISGRAVSVVLPKDYSVSGTVKAVFDLSRNDSGYPFVSTSSETVGNRAFNSRFTEKSISLTSGSASFTFYYYNKDTGAVDNGGQTRFVISVRIKNDKPVLFEGIGNTTDATVTAGEYFTLNLAPLFTDIDGDELTYKVSINGASAISAEANYSFTSDIAGNYTLTFTANDGKDDSDDTYTVNLTVENSAETDCMTVYIPEGLSPEFFVTSGFSEGVDTLGDSVDRVIGKTEDGMTAYTLNYPVNAEMISVRTEDFGGMAFAVQKDDSVTFRKVQLTVVDYDNSVAESTSTVTSGESTAVEGSIGWLLMTGEEYTFTATPKNSDLSKSSKTVTVEADTETLAVRIMLGLSNPMSITVPSGASAQLYKYNRYYSNTELDAKIVNDNGDGTTTYQFIADTKANGASYIYRVSMEDKITKAGWLAWNQQNLAIAYSENDKSPSYRLDDYSMTGEENSSVAEDSVLLNVNSRNHLNMSVGQSKTLKAYRAWEIIPASYNNYIITPDFTYTILSGNDTVSLEEKDSPSAGEGDWMTLTAVKEGVAIIEVTYDAIEVSGGGFDGIYGASDPSRTGLIVVQVGERDDTTVKFGIESFASAGKVGSNNITYNSDKPKEWDAEFDTLYFTGNSGELKLTPSASADISEVSVSHDKGESWITLEGENSTYTAEIVQGNNILRVKTATGTAYQIVRGDKITVKFAEDKEHSNDNGIVEAGETVRVYLVGLHNPIPKMAGNYNPGYNGNYDGYSSQHINYTCNGKAIYGIGRQYNFISAANYIDIVMPDDGSSAVLEDGYIGLGVIGLTGFADGGDCHRNIPDDGCTTRANETTYHTRSILPGITVSVGDTSALNNAPIVRKDAITEKEIYKDQSFAINPETLFADADGDTLSFTASVNGEGAKEASVDYKFTPDGTGIYTLLFTATDGKESVQHTVTLTVKKRPSQGATTEKDDKFGLDDSEIAGYVKISFVDKGVRVKGETGLKYPKSLGTIIATTKVPFKDGEKITHVTKRLLDSLGIRMSYSGTLEAGFYLGAICDFELNGTPYDSMGEFDAGVGSGWMITLNKTFIKYGASEFEVKNGDTIKWQYTCQLGKDIGDPFYSGIISSGNSKTEKEDKEEAKEETTEEVKEEIKEEQKEKSEKKVFTETTFVDVKKDSWYYDSVKYAYENNLMQGTDKGFEPESTMTRAMLVTVLFRMASTEITEASHSFNDVPTDEWYSDAVAWAYKKGIVNGVTETEFAPNNNVTREQTALIIYRFAKMQGISVEDMADISVFSDVDDVSEWAIDAFRWASKAEIINGTSQTTLSPKATATRAQVAKILMCFCENVHKAEVTE